jgi:hypothetical protein
MKMRLGILLAVSVISQSAFAKTISFSGEVSERSVQKLIANVRAAALAGKPVEIKFTSKGGDLVAAIAGYEELAKYNVTTNTQDECGSACTVLYAAGVERKASASAQFYFHKVGVKVEEGDSSSASVASYRQQYASEWLRVIRNVAPGLAAELERDGTLIKGERTIRKTVALKHGYVNVK